MSPKRPRESEFEWAPRNAPEDQLVLDLDGYEGPIDVLLSLFDVILVCPNQHTSSETSLTQY